MYTHKLYIYMFKLKLSLIEKYGEGILEWCRANVSTLVYLIEQGEVDEMEFSLRLFRIQVSIRWVRIESQYRGSSGGDLPGS